MPQREITPAGRAVLNVAKPQLSLRRPPAAVLPAAPRHATLGLGGDALDTLGLGSDALDAWVDGRQEPEALVRHEAADLIDDVEAVDELEVVDGARLIDLPRRSLNDYDW